MTSTTDDRAVTLPGGIRMPLIGLGAWKLTGEPGYQAIRLALELGYRHLDTATMYGNEAEVGRAIRDSGVPREDIFVTTKLPPRRAGAERDTITASLRALGTDYVDLWLIHWPPGGAAPEVWREFIAARDAGLTRTIGVSNYRTGQLDELTKETGETPAVNQIEWSPSLYDAQRLAEHRERGIVLEGYSPFKSTNLRHPALTKIADAHGVRPAQIIVRWHLQRDTVVIPKSSRPERLKSNFDVYGFALTSDEMSQLDQLP
ncbi:MAG: aldo/keto reductase [Micromonosporaceae bacterium]